MFKKFGQWYQSQTKRNHIAPLASRLLNDEAFLIAVEKKKNGLLNDLLNSLPGEKEKREDIYRKCTLLEELVLELSTLVNAADEEESK